MKEYQASSIRNIALFGHGSEGKTTLAEAMLFTAGAIDRMGRVENGSATMDYDPEETKRTISISTALAPVEWKNNKINIIDLPGFFDFIGESYGAIRAIDAAVILVGAVGGLTVGAEKAFTLTTKNNVPKMVVINSMDRENANFDRTLEQLTEKYGSVIAPVSIPIMQGGAFKGYASVLTGKSFAFDGKGAKEIPTPDDVQARLEELRETVTEAAASADEELMDKYFEEGELSPEEISQGLHKGIMDGSIVPVVPTAAAPNLGVANLMDVIVDLVPSSDKHEAIVGINPKNDEEEERVCEDAQPFSAQVFKTLADPFVGKLSLIKVFSGKLTGDMTLYNPNAEKNEKAGNISTMLGKKLVSLDALHAGDIGALAKLQYTNTGDTLCDEAKPIRFAPIQFPEPSISMAVSAKKQGEEDKLYSGLHRLEEEDPSFKVSKPADTAETIISGQGESHIDVIAKKLASKFGVECVLDDPKIPYRETIKKPIDAEGRHKKQTGGHGQFGHCWVLFEPITDSEEDFEFVDKVVGGVVPRAYIPAVEKGLRENLPRGIVAGYPIVKLRATLHDGSYHPVDSSEMAFKTAARLALRKCVNANPVILEPINHVEVVVPDDYMGDIIGDMNRRRGRIMGMNKVEDGQQVVAEVPLSEMFKYATDLRSMTQARGSFTMHFERYEEVPANIAAKIIAGAKKIEDDDD